MQPTSRDHFEDYALHPIIIARLAIEDVQVRKNQTLTAEQNQEFIQHSDVRLRWMHANNGGWQKRLDRQSNNDRDFIKVFVEHWAEAYLKDPVDYMLKHPLNQLV